MPLPLPRLLTRDNVPGKSPWRGRQDAITGRVSWHNVLGEGKRKRPDQAVGRVLHALHHVPTHSAAPWLSPCCSPDSNLLSWHVKPKLVFHHPSFVSHDAPDSTCLSHKPAIEALIPSLPAGLDCWFCFVYGSFQFSHIIVSICRNEFQE